MSAERGRSARRDGHEVFDELAVGWALHALEPEDEAVFVRHLPDCHRCERTVADTAEVMAAMAGDLPHAEPSDTLHLRLRAAVEETQQLHRPLAADLDDPGVELDDDPGPPRAPAADVPAPPRAATGFPGYTDTPPVPPPPQPWWRRSLPMTIAAAAVAAVVALGAWNVFLVAGRDEMRTTVAQQSQVVAALLQPGRATIAPLSDPAGRPVATVVARGDQLQVVTQHLSVNDPHATTYVVWGMREDTATALGTFDVVHSDLDLRTVGSAPTGAGSFPAYGISLEPGRQAPSTPTKVVATGEVTS